MSIGRRITCVKGIGESFCLSICSWALRTMSPSPQLHRSGSLLVFSDAADGRRPRAVRQKPSTEPRRTSYSYHCVLSPSQGAVVLKTRLHEALLAWADTEPLVRAIAMPNQMVRFREGRNERTVHIPLLVEWGDGSRCYWDAAFAATNPESPGTAAKRTFAAAADADYRLFCWTTFFSRQRTELKSRLALQNFLYSGLAVGTEEIEPEALLRLAQSPCTVAELAKVCHVDDHEMLLAIARLWRRGAVCWPIASTLPGPHLPVSLRSAHGR